MGWSWLRWRWIYPDWMWVYLESI